MGEYLNHLIQSKNHADAILEQLYTYDNNTIDILNELLEFSEGGGETLESVRQKIHELIEGLS